MFAFLESASEKERFDIILADPPYEKTKSGGEFTRLLLANQQLSALLEPSGIFVLEKRPEEETFASDLWQVVRAKAYGATEVLFLVPAETRLSTPSKAE